MKITWQQRMTNKIVVELAEINEILSCEIRRRRWNWLGHVLRRGRVEALECSQGSSAGQRVLV